MKKLSIKVRNAVEESVEFPPDILHGENERETSAEPDQMPSEKIPLFEADEPEADVLRFLDHVETQSPPPEANAEYDINLEDLSSIDSDRGLNTSEDNRMRITPSPVPPPVPIAVPIVPSNFPHHPVITSQRTSSQPLVPHINNTLSVLSYNLSGQDRTSALKQIIALLKVNSPDLLCFQEVTPLAHRFLSECLLGYQSVESFIKDGRMQGLTIFLRLSKYQLIEPSQYEYSQTTDHHDILDCEIMNLKTHRRCHLINTQFDHSKRERVNQIRELRTLVEELDHVILCGNFTIKDLSDDESFMEIPLKDTWRALGCPSQVKYSYDYKRNRNVPDQRQERPDRILYRLPHNSHPRAMKLIGVETSRALAPSEYFGVIVWWDTI